MAGSDIDQTKEITLLELLDVILDKGVAIRGELIISIANIDLVYLDLRILLTSVESLMNSKEDSNENNDIHSGKEFSRWNKSVEKMDESSLIQTTSRKDYPNSSLR